MFYQQVSKVILVTITWHYSQMTLQDIRTGLFLIVKLITNKEER